MRAIIGSLILSLLAALAYAKPAPPPANMTAAQASAKPTSDETKRVLHYYLYAKGGSPVLVDVKLCRGIIASGEHKNDCEGEITQPLREGQPVYLWMAYMVPLGEGTQNVVILFDKDGVTRKVENLQVSSQLFNRSWIKTSFDAKGAWKLRVVRDSGVGPDPLGAHDVVVK